MAKRKTDYAFRAYVMAIGLCPIEREMSFKMYLYNELKKFGGSINDTNNLFGNENMESLESLIEARDILIKEYGLAAWEEAHRINAASYARRNRLSKRILAMLDKPCIFLTLTFNDKVLESTSIETRRKYVTRFLKACSDVYVANIDYGSKNNREHYHAIVQCDNVDNKLWQEYTHSTSSINFRRIKGSGTTDMYLDTATNSKLAKYIVKLTNHAVKETTKRNYTIYSKVS